MKIYKTQEEVEKDIKDNVLTIDDSVSFECSNSIKCLSIKARREKYQKPICLDGKLEIL